VTAEMVTSIDRLATRSPAEGRCKQGNNGNGHRPPGGNGGGSSGPESVRNGFSSAKYRIAMWVALAAILMMFTSMVSAYIVLASTDTWRSIPFPSQLWLSTALILASSLTFKRSLRFLKQNVENSFRRWLWVTAALGLSFLISQLIVWLQMIAVGIQVEGNARALFYVLTGLHAVHVLGGMAALGYLLVRKDSGPTLEEAALKKQTAVEVVGLYWHFMDGLWICLFFLLLFWR